VELGIFARTFPRPTLEATFDAVRATGLRTMQYKRLHDVPAAQVHAAASARGLTMAAVSGTYNMAHPDPGVRAAGARELAGLVAEAPALGTRVVTLCTGTRDPDDLWRAHPDNGSAAAWRDLRASVDAALEVAEAHGVTLGVEPEPANVVADAAAARRLLDEVATPHLRIVLDAANLVQAAPGRQHAILDEAFGLLGGDLVLAHAKDVTAGGAIVAAGRGVLDHERYLDRLEAAGAPPLVLHGLAEDEVAASIAVLRR
jgi:sugar phosphate isomerase/epimerase